MSLTSPENAGATGNPLATTVGYGAIALFVLLSYISVLGRYEEFANYVLPSGDPFTYTLTWFRLLDDAKAQYFRAIVNVFRGEYAWYRLMEVPIALLSPILTKDPAVLSVVNYLIWGLGTAAFFRLGLAIGLGVGRAFVMALVPWLWPVNYGFTDYDSIPVLALDAAFTGALMLALGNSFVFALDPRRTVNALVAALSIGIAVWGRGNSAPVVALVVCWPCLLAIWNARQVDGRRAWLNVAAAAVLATAMTVEFYVTYWHGIIGYYSLHADFATRHHWNLHDALPYLKNIPGFMYWRSEDSWLAMGLSWASHLVPLIALAVAWRNRAPGSERIAAYRQLAIAGAFIYFGTYATDLVLWTDPQMTIYNALLIWRPMLIGLSLSVIVLFLSATDWLRKERDLQMLLPAGAAMLIWGAAWNAYYTPWDWSIGRPNPQTVERFALGIDSFLEGAGPLGMLWYGSWNFSILRYYRAKDDYPELPLYTGRYFDDIWSQADYSPENRKRVLEGIKQNFLKAGLVIIGEFSNDYTDDQPYALYHLKQDWVNWLNSPAAPRLRVRVILARRRLISACWLCSVRSWPTAAAIRFDCHGVIGRTRCPPTIRTRWFAFR